MVGTKIALSSLIGQESCSFDTVEKIVWDGKPSVFGSRVCQLKLWRLNLLLVS